MGIVVRTEDSLDVDLEFHQRLRCGFIESLLAANSSHVGDVLNEIIDLERAAHFLDAAREEFAVSVLIVEARHIVIRHHACGLRVVVFIGGPREQHVGWFFGFFAHREKGCIAWLDEDHCVGEVFFLTFDCEYACSCHNVIGGLVLGFDWVLF